MANGAPMPFHPQHAGGPPPVMHGIPDITSQMHSVNLDPGFPNGPNGPKGAKLDNAKFAQQSVKSSSYYEGWTVRRAESLPGERKSWARIERSRMPFSEDDLAKQVKRKKSRKTTMDIYRKLKFDNQRAQIDRLLVDCNKPETDPNRKWGLEFIEPVEGKNPKYGNREITRINVILKRHVKPSAADRFMSGPGKTQGLSGAEIIDLKDPIPKAKPPKGQGMNEPLPPLQQPFPGHGHMPPQAQNGFPKAAPMPMPMPMPNHNQQQGFGFGGPPVPPAPPVPPRHGQGHDLPSMRTPGPAKGPNPGFPTPKRANALPGVLPSPSDIDFDHEDDDDYPVQIIDSFKPNTKRSMRKPKPRPKRVMPPPIDVHVAQPQFHQKRSRPHHRGRSPEHWRADELNDSVDDDVDSIFTAASNGSIGTTPSTPPSAYSIPRRHASPRHYWDRRGSREHAFALERPKDHRYVRGRRHSDQPRLPIEKGPYHRDQDYDIFPAVSNHHQTKRLLERRLPDELPRVVHHQPVFGRQAFADNRHFDGYDDIGFDDRRAYGGRGRHSYH